VKINDCVCQRPILAAAIIVLVLIILEDFLVSLIRAWKGKD